MLNVVKLDALEVQEALTKFIEAKFGQPVYGTVRIVCEPYVNRSRSFPTADCQIGVE